MKVFISHSSKQKAFAEEIRKEIGADNCIIDKYDFSPAFKTMDEIVGALDESGIFVFLVSVESLKSNWCENEVIKARGLVEKGKIKFFLPYIIDHNVDLQHIRDKYDWIVSEDTYNLKFFKSARIVARDIDLKFRIIERKQLPFSHLEDEIFIGRNNKIDEFQTKKARKRKAKALVVSGRPGIGRKRFSMQCALQLKRLDRFFLENIILDPKDGLPELLVWLNNLTSFYSEERLRDILRFDEDQQVEAAIELINEVYKYQGRIRIVDHKSIVDYRSQYSPWFLKIVDSEKIDEHLGIHIITAITPNHQYDINNNLIAIKLDAMTKTERINLLSEYLLRLNASDCTDEDIEEFAGKLNHSPSQLIRITEVIKETSVGEARRLVEFLRTEGNLKIKDLLQFCAEDQLAMDFLAIIADSSLLSYEDIKAIFGDKYTDIEEIIQQLLLRGIVSEFGLSGSYLRIDAAVRDYIIRNKISISKGLKDHFEDYLKEAANKNVSLTDNPSLYILTTLQALKDGRFKVRDMLLPSVALNYLIGLYNAGDTVHYKSAVAFCNQLLTDDLGIWLKDDIKQEIIFWKCLSLSHLHYRDQFDETIQNIKDTSSKFFLKGFFKRKSEDYEGALHEFNRALKINPGMNISRREKVKALIELKDYDGALDDARKNFEQAKDNSYHITAYFDCLLLKSNRTNEDENEMKKLIEIMRSSMMAEAEAFVAGMEMKYKVRQPGLDREKVLKELSQMKSDFPNNKYVKNVILSCYKYLGIA